MIKKCSPHKKLKTSIRVWHFFKEENWNLKYLKVEIFKA